ncbi:MAG: PTS sugar transporter subunit IIA [Victivallales bacterium]|nr:PTS sugar transporter subunit IIA [Victivallales bacterium]
MKLNFILNKHCIIPQLKPERNKQILIEKLVNALYAGSTIKDEKVNKYDIIEALINRENEQTTALGEGLAFPHARIEGLKKSYTLFATSKKGIDFESLDGELTNFFILNLVSDKQPNILLKTRAAVSRFLSLKDIREQILECENISEIWNIIEQSNIEMSYDITARDIMSPQNVWISEETLLKDAARMLHKHHVDSLPVLDKNENLLGVLSCLELFSYSMPDFFFNLRKISFIKHMDPFEKYFKVDEKLDISGIMKTDNLPVVEPSATLMEIIFEMTVNRRELIYVVEDQKLLGVLDRYSIIDKILVVM